MNLLENHLHKKTLSPKENREIFSQMLDGGMSEAQVSAHLILWRQSGETTELLIEGAKALRARSKKMDVPSDLRPLADNCGTGGSGIAKFNVSTTAGILAASMGVRVAKHGNRNVSGVCGSADLLFAAGLAANLTSDQTLKGLKNSGFAFFFAPDWHPSMRHVGSVRKSLGIRTVFNLLGPLANPVAPDFQIIGVAAKKYLRPIAEALVKLGTKRSLVVHAQNGLDEISDRVPTDCALVEKKKVRMFLLKPEATGIKPQKAIFKTPSIAVNLEIFKKTLAGEPTPVVDAIVLNAAALLWVTGNSVSIKTGVAACREQLKTGSVLTFFEDWLKETKS